MSTDTRPLPRFAEPIVEREPEGIRVVVRWEPSEDLDRLDAYAWGVGDRPDLAVRLIRAIKAGVILKHGGWYTDVTGARGHHATCTILSRTMNAELRRKGF